MRTRSGSEWWFGEGLRFRCRRCGACCTGEPGYVFVEDGEIAAMAEYLGTGESSFRRRYTRPAAGRVSLREKKDGGCVFHSDEGCRVYRARPLQCRTFPFWLSVVRRRESWDAAARECPGMGRGRFYRTAEIVELIAGRMKRED